MLVNNTAIKTAAQKFHALVADSLEFLGHDLKDPKFKGWSSIAYTKQCVRFPNWSLKHPQ